MRRVMEVLEKQGLLRGTYPNYTMGCRCLQKTKSIADWLNPYALRVFDAYRSRASRSWLREFISARSSRARSRSFRILSYAL